jgi:xylulokinase
VSRVQPERLARARWCLSPADLVAGWFSGEWGSSDWTNVLKMGYDLLDLRWPTFISQDLGLPAGLLPRVVAPGTPIGAVSAQAAERTGLPVGARVVAGSTDGVAAQLASGAVSPGDWNSTLGTTLVIKGVSRSLLRDAQGRIYCHRHPEGYWLPGGASSTGAECLAVRFGQDLDALNRAALAHTPSGVVVYPLVRRGERFPFCRPEATGFALDQAADRQCLYAAHLEGIAYVERLAYDVLRDLGASVGGTIHVAGGGIQSEAGLQVRADVLNRRLVAPAVPSAAMGAAVLAAYGHSQDGLSAVARRMVRHTREVTPRPGYHGMYADGYGRFVRACKERGYLP